MKKLLVFILFYSCFSSIYSQKINQNKSTATSNVFLLNKVFLIPNLDSVQHKIWIYLPPDYATSNKHYPVIYMHDGQNLFDKKTSYAGEWQVDETLNTIFKETGKGFIVVGIENAGVERINEYTPWKNQKYGGGKGKIYINFLAKTLKPYIDAQYRTKKNSKNTALIGSSLGGLISYYGGLKYPMVFGKIGALSTSFWFSKKVINFTKEYGNTNRIKLFLYAGGKEGDSMDVDTQKMALLLLKTGFKTSNLKIKINPTGIHNETTWKNEFPQIIKWLFNTN